MRYEVKVTWTLHGTRNAAGVGNDESLTIKADSPQDACREAAEGHLDRYESDWHTGRYDVMAEHVGGSAIYGIEFCEA